jgi:hypothetical protein
MKIRNLDMSPEITAHAALPRPARIALVALAAAGMPAGLVVVWLTWWSAWSWLGVALMSFSPMLAARLASRFFTVAGMRPAMRRYSNRLAATMVLYFVILLAVTQAYREGLAVGPLGYLLAILPAIPILAIFVLYGRYFREETDEVMRDIVMTSLVWSGALTLCEATVWGFLETFGKAPNLWMWVVPVAFFAQLGITGAVAGRKFR